MSNVKDFGAVGDGRHDDTEAFEHAIADGDGALIVRMAEELHAADAADVLEQLSWDQFEQALMLAPRAFAPEVLIELNEEHLEEALKILPVPQLAHAVAELDSDDAALLVDNLDDERREEVLAATPKRDRDEVLESLSFDEETAGRLMQREFVAAPEHWTVGDAIDHMSLNVLRRQESRLSSFASMSLSRFITRSRYSSVAALDSSACASCIEFTIRPTRRFTTAKVETMMKGTKNAHA